MKLSAVTTRIKYLDCAENCCRAQVPVDYTLATDDIFRLVIEHHLLHHENRDTVQRLCILRSVVERASPGSLGRSVWPTRSDSRLLGAIGTVRGRILYLTPPLNILSSGNPISLPEPPRLTTLLERQLWYLHCARQYWSKPLNIENVEYFKDRRSYSHTKPFTSTNVNYNTNGNKAWEPLPSNKVRELIWLLMHHHDNDPQRSRKPRLFLEENGMIGFAPHETEIGDILCQFKNCDVVVVVRPYLSNPHHYTLTRPHRYTLLGRAVSYREDPRLFRDHDAISESKFEDSIIRGLVGERYVTEYPIYRDFEHSISFRLDLGTFQLLTRRPSKTEHINVGEPDWDEDVREIMRYAEVNRRRPPQRDGG